MTTKKAGFFKQIGRALSAKRDRDKTLSRLAEYHQRSRSLDEIVDFAMKFGGGGGLYRIKTLQKRSEILSLAGLVRELEPEIILEIGTERGGTLLIWAALASQRVISCDIQDMHVQQALYSRFPPPGSECSVTLMSGDSHSMDFLRDVEAELAGQPVDFLFIDGDHTEQGVESDFNMYRRLVRPGGLVAFHDIIEKQPLQSNQVYSFWTRIKNDYEHYEFIDDPNQCGYGIGVLRML